LERVQHTWKPVLRPDKRQTKSHLGLAFKFGQAFMRLQIARAGLFALVLCAGTASAQQEPKLKVTPLLETITTITGRKLIPEMNPQVTATIVEIPPGFAGNSRRERSSSRRFEPVIAA
jgi:hypothetical protein